ncbi:MAG: hypothetical protein IRY91_04320 [Gemmatimonadaceae bacterium]|nr:hypothetical protein [Gemmatimonadaceae bacterium]
MREGQPPPRRLRDRRPRYIDVPGPKTDEAAATIYVDPDFWEWIDHGIPSPLAYK